MNQLPYEQPQHLGYTPQQPEFASSEHEPWVQAPAANIGLATAAVIWAGIGLIGHSTMTLYLGLGAVMTHSLDGVFGDDPSGAFNLTVLLIALIGQVLGLALSVTAMIIGIGARKKQMRRGTTAMVLGIVATATFLLIGLIQLPLVALLFDVIQLRASGSFAG